MNTAFVLVNCDLGYEIQTIEKLKGLCDEVQGTYGIYDFIGKINYRDIETLEKKLQKVRQVEKVTHTVTIHTIPEQSSH